VPLVRRAIAEVVFSLIGRCYVLGQSQASVVDEVIPAGSEIDTLGRCYQYLDTTGAAAPQLNR
jgi:hypothetical protein